MLRCGHYYVWHWHLDTRNSLFPEFCLQRTRICFRFFFPLTLHVLDSVSLTGLVTGRLVTTALRDSIIILCASTTSFQTVHNKENFAKTMAKIELCRGWGPRPSASQTGWGPHQRRWSNDACATLQRRLRHELAWIWTDFLSEQRQATDFVEPAGGRATNDSLYDARTRLKISSQ